MTPTAHPMDSGGQEKPGSPYWWEAALVFAVFFIAGGAPAPHVNEGHYLTKAKHYWDASYCPGDFFLDSADPHVVFYWTIGWLTRILSLPAVAWCGRVVAWWLLALAWLRVSRSVIAAPWVAVLGAALWVALIEHGNFAGEWVVGGVEAKCFAYALVLMGLAALARGSWRTMWIWFGAAAAFHVLVGAWAVVAGLGVWLTEPRAQRATLRSILPGLLLGGLLSLPGLLPALALERNTDSAIVQEAARIYVFDRLPHHLAPLSLPPAELQGRLIRFGLVAAAMATLWAWASRQQMRTESRLAERESGLDNAEMNWTPLVRLMRFAGFAVACNFAGLAIEAALTDRPLAAARALRYYWFRQADVAVPLAVALGTERLVVSLVRRRSAWAGVAAAASMLACGWFLAAASLGRLNQPIPPAAARLPRFEDWRTACEWVHDHAPADARFLIPRSGHSFKWYAARADVASYKDVPQDAASVVEWRRRCEQLFPTIEEDGEIKTLSSPEQWGTQRARALARQYGASHVIARGHPALDLPVVYPRSAAGESYYTVYETGVKPGAKDP